MVQNLQAIVSAVRGHPGIRNKAPIALVADVLGRSDWQAGPGDDGAVVAAGDTTLVVGGEALWPPFVEADPFAAGVAAVLANVNDLAAMGAIPLAIVDTIIASEATARRALEGMRHASALYQVPVVGGHLTIHDGPPAVSAFGLGHAPDGQVLSCARAQAGQPLLLACCTEGEMRADFPFFGSFTVRGERLGGDVRTLATVAGSGAAVAAKDVSMAGLVGSLAMLLECSRLGVTLDLDALPRPDGVALLDWLVCFPCFAFLVCAPPGQEEDCAAPFRERGLRAEVVGTLDGSGVLGAQLGTEVATVFDLNAEPVTGLPPPG
jgi:uncharacterized protein